MAWTQKSNLCEEPCRKCCGLNGVHYLTCPELSLSAEEWARICGSPERAVPVAAFQSAI